MSNEKGKPTRQTVASDAQGAIAFVREQGAVLMSAKGSVARLVEVIAGEPIRGSWWGHPQGRRIFAALRKVSDSPDILTCRLIDGHVTFVHRRLWPALLALAAQIRPDRLAQIREEHTPSGHHVSHAIPFPEWVPREVTEEARLIGGQHARALLGSLADILLAPARPRKKSAPRGKRPLQPKATRRPVKSPRPTSRRRP